MARNKAIFDADILINMVKTKSMDFSISMFDQIYISDYVWNTEIKDGTEEKRVIAKLQNKGFIVLLEYNKLTPKQQLIYQQTYDILKNKAPLEYVNEGERITASYANAHSVAYYMSDDNRAAPYIRSFTELLVINYCDLLFMGYSIDSKNVKQIAEYYDAYITLFERNQIPKILLDRNGRKLDFATVMAKSSDKYSKNRQLAALLKLLTDNKNWLC